MTSKEFDVLWQSLSEEQKQKVKDKAQWEQMSIWAVLNDWPEIWNEGESND